MAKADFDNNLGFDAHAKNGDRGQVMLFRLAILLGCLPALASAAVLRLVL